MTKYHGGRAGYGRGRTGYGRYGGAGRFYGGYNRYPSYGRYYATPYPVFNAYSLPYPYPVYYDPNPYDNYYY